MAQKENRTYRQVFFKRNEEDFVLRKLLVRYVPNSLRDRSIKGQTESWGSTNSFFSPGRTTKREEKISL